MTTVGIRGHMGHIGILVVVVRRLSRRWKVKTLLAGPSPTSPMRRRLPTPLFPTTTLCFETDIQEHLHEKACPAAQFRAKLSTHIASNIHNEEY